jgi:hypothetical protein
MDKVDNANDSLIDGLDRVPEIFVEGYRGAAMRAGIIKLNFFSNQFDPGRNVEACRGDDCRASS